MYCNVLAKLQNAAGQEPPFVAMMANGTSGDINNANFRTPRPNNEHYEQMSYVAEGVAAKVSAVLAKVEWKDRAGLDACFRELELSWRQLDAKLLAWAKENYTDAPLMRSDLTTIYAGRVLRLAEAKNPALIPLQVFRIGDICIGTFPCETFAEIGLEVKKRSPIVNSFMVRLNRGYFGYLPTHHCDWIDACKGGEPATSRFAYAAHLTEIAMLGVLSLRAQKPVEWDANAMKSKGLPAADAFVKESYRKGWEIV